MSDKEELKEKVIVLRNYSNVLQKKRKIKDDTILRNQKLIYKLQEETKRQQKEIERLNNIIKDIKDYINFLVIYNQTINGKFSETQWGEDILGLIGSDK